MSHSDLQKIQTWITQLDKKIDQLAKKLDQKADKDEMDFKFERVYRQMDERFTKVDDRIDSLMLDLNIVKRQMLKMGDDLDFLKARHI